ncbi:hypothetical protein IQ247_19890 [Plectonema cf. radiosum LEGE 06105]|uniref:Uncharacterized protein n=1 Tax=Plectonema cf. radiosum LEGE 06105 TaxID=945769 RepID=A0A8J7K1P8_9CYAN|nr:hypothetical protein [Plectonema radiosum]MBE9214906.1 hypothetical protein [Plectonema cf. radiosum LEGE 06105]
MPLITDFDIDNNIDMTQSVAQKNSVSEKTWRRQTDSPGWWIAFSCGSVILHLLAFWLISLYEFNLSQQRRPQSAVAIEFIDISPQKSSPVQPQIKPKPIPPKPLNTRTIVPQNSQPPVNPSTVKPPVTSIDRDAIAFDNQKIQQQQRQLELEQQRQLEAILRQQAEQLRQRQAQQQQLEAQIRQQELAQQQQLEAQIRQQELAQQQQLEAQIRQQELEQQQQLQAQIRQQELEQQQQLQAQRQQELEQQQLEQRRLAQQSRLEAEEQRQLATQQQPQNPVDGEKIADAPTNALGQTPQQSNKTSPVPIQNQPTQSGGILTASWKIDTNTFVKDKPDNLAQPLKRINSDIPLPPPKDGNFQPRDFLVWLTIDNQGNLLLIKVDEAIPLAQRTQYQEYAEEIFNGQKFIPASGNNGNKPDLSNLPIRVNIQNASQ